MIGANALYFLFAWLISAAAASWLSERKGYGERVGLTFGLILSAVGLLIVLLGIPVYMVWTRQTLRKQFREVGE